MEDSIWTRHNSAAKSCRREINQHTTRAFVKAWLRSRICAAVILIIFVIGRHQAIKHLYLSSTSVLIKHLN